MFVEKMSKDSKDPVNIAQYILKDIKEDKIDKDLVLALIIAALGMFIKNNKIL